MNWNSVHRIIIHGSFANKAYFEAYDTLSSGVNDILQENTFDAIPYIGIVSSIRVPPFVWLGSNYYNFGIDIER